jgi:phosphoglycolate phosphatase
MSATRLVVFDLDGTLIDSRRDLARAANEVLAGRGGGPLAEEAVTRMVGDGARALLERAFAAAGLPAPGDADLDAFNRCYHQHLFDTTRPYGGADAMVRAAAAHGAASLLTNKPASHTARLVEHFGWASLLAVVVGGDGAWPRKPSPEGLRAVMAQVGVPASATVLVGDSHVDLATAKAAGVRFALARYGFGAESVEPALLGPDDWELESPAGLAQRLAG